MDMLTLKLAKKYAESLISGESQDIEALEAELATIDLDGDTAVELLINAFRQHVWKNESEAPVCEEGSVTLTNTGKYPFNNSVQTVALANTQKNTKYAVIPEIVSANGNPGEAVVSDKQVNGFKLAYTGSASSAVVKYIVIGGIIS